MISDDDTRGVVRSTWANMELCESGAANKAALTQVQGTVQDEAWSDTEADMQEWIRKRIQDGYRKPYPNPVTDTLTLGFETSWHLYNSAGGLTLEGWGNTVPMGNLPTGFYTLHDGVNSHKIIKR